MIIAVHRLSKDNRLSGEMSRVVLSNVCPYCEAMPGQECTSVYGSISPSHMARWDVADGTHPGLIIIDEEPW